MNKEEVCDEEENEEQIVIPVDVVVRNQKP
jgi:hypothetical protein